MAYRAAGPWARAVCWRASPGYSSEVPEPVDDQFRLRRLRIQRQLAPSGRRRWQLGPVSEPHSGDQVPGRPHRRWSSRQLHRLGGLASHAWAGVIVALVALAWVARRRPHRLPVILAGHPPVGHRRGHRGHALCHPAPPSPRPDRHATQARRDPPVAAQRRQPGNRRRRSPRR